MIRFECTFIQVIFLRKRAFKFPQLNFKLEGKILMSIFPIYRKSKKKSAIVLVGDAFSKGSFFEVVVGFVPLKIGTNFFLKPKNIEPEKVVKMMRGSS